MAERTPLNYALNLLKLRDRTEAEIKRKMSEKGFAEEEITQTISFLVDKKFIDDLRMADAMTKSQSYSGKGKLKLREKMYRLGFDPDLIKESIGSIDPESELAKAGELADKWLIKNEQKDKQYERLGRFLISRGFEIDIVKKALGIALKNK